MLTNFYNIWHVLYWVNLQYNNYWFVHLTYVLPLHYLGKVNLLLLGFGLAHRARQTIELLHRETPKCIPLDLWPLNSPYLNPVDCRIWGVMQDYVYQTPVRDVAYLRQYLIYTRNRLIAKHCGRCCWSMAHNVNEKGGGVIFWVKCRLAVWENGCFISLYNKKV